MNNSVIDNHDDKAQLYYDLHSVTVQFAPAATPEMVKKALFHVADGGGYDRVALALKLFWTLSNGYYAMAPTTEYLIRIGELTGEPISAKVYTITTEQSLQEMIAQEGMNYREVGEYVYADDIRIGLKASLVGAGTAPVWLRVHAACTGTDRVNRVRLKPE